MSDSASLLFPVYAQTTTTCLFLQDIKMGILSISANCGLHISIFPTQRIQHILTIFAPQKKKSQVKHQEET